MISVSVHSAGPEINTIVKNLSDDVKSFTVLLKVWFDGCWHSVNIDDHPYNGQCEWTLQGESVFTGNAGFQNVLRQWNVGLLGDGAWIALCPSIGGPCYWRWADERQSWILEVDHSKVPVDE